jgi:MtrB/PioB family decaheme-associated outer membrane protein
MKLNIIIFTGILCLSPFFDSFDSFAEESQFKGEITLTGVFLDTNGNEAKFKEYNDLRNGAYGRIHLNYDTEKYFMDFKAGDIAYDTQNYRLGGGMWGKFKVDIYYDEFPHNFTFGARSFYQGIGGNFLTYPGAAPNPNFLTWNEFDYSIKRKNLGGGLKLEMLKPFYFDVSASREERDGTYPIGVSLRSPGGPALEQLALPIDYTTTDIKLEGGYAKNPFFFSFSYLYSQFENDNNKLYFRNPAAALGVTTPDIFTLPPDNHYFKLAFKGAVKLPMNSKFSTNLAFSRAKSEADLISYYLNNAGAVVPLTLSDPKFNGKIDTQNYHFVLSSNPISFLEGKIFYKHYKTSNKSDQILTTDITSVPPTELNDLFDYKKDTVGLELGFKLPAKFYLNTFYHYIKTKREREDIPENKDNLYSVELRWNGLDFMLPKIGYERLNRKAKFEGSIDPNDIELWVRRFDAAAQIRDTYKASIDFSPIENLNFGISYKYKKADYQNTIIGLTSEKSNLINIDGDFTIGKFVKLFGYFGFERIDTDQFQRQFAAPPPADAGNPITGPTSATRFNWDAKQKEKEYDYGIGVEIYAIPKKLTFVLQHDYVRSNGLVDYTVFRALNPGETQDNIDLPAWDDYRQDSYMIKAVYNVVKGLSFTLGYAYERFNYKDAQYEGFRYTVGAFPANNTSALTGAYVKPSYSTNLVFLGATYKF